MRLWGLIVPKLPYELLCKVQDKEWENPPKTHITVIGMKMSPIGSDVWTLGIHWVVLFGEASVVLCWRKYITGWTLRWKAWRHFQFALCPVLAVEGVDSRFLLLPPFWALLSYHDGLIPSVAAWSWCWSQQQSDRDTPRNRASRLRPAENAIFWELCGLNTPMYTSNSICNSVHMAKDPGRTKEIENIPLLRRPFLPGQEGMWVIRDGASRLCFPSMALVPATPQSSLLSASKLLKGASRVTSFVMLAKAQLDCDRSVFTTLSRGPTGQLASLPVKQGTRLKFRAKWVTNLKLLKTEGLVPVRNYNSEGLGA